MNVTLSKRGGYAARAAICLAHAYETGRPKKLREISAEMDIPRTFVSQILQARLRTGSAWLTSHAEASDEEVLRVRVGPLGHGWAGKTVAMHLGEPAEAGDSLLIPLVWEAAGPLGLFPRFEGKLALAALDQERCELGLSGRYRPPLGKAGQVLDEVLLTRVAQATLRALLRRVARVLEEEQPPATTA